MGSSAQDTQNEIGRLRDDMTAAVREMQRRFQGGLPGVVRSDARYYGNEARTELSSQVRNNPTRGRLRGDHRRGGRWLYRGQLDRELARRAAPRPAGLAAARARRAGPSRAALANRYETSNKSVGAASC